jgi:3',5'-cyclic AMP phosphodiesterase CpdA
MHKLPAIIKSLLINLLIGCIFAGVGFAQNENSDSPWFFIQITDPQFGMFENNEGFEKETILYEKAVTEVNRLRPDFVVITGDFVHNQHSLEQIAEFKRITAKIDAEIPVYYSPGNHDVGKDPTRESLKNYTQRYGKDRFSFEHKGAFFIGFNTSLIKSNMPVKEYRQFKWLRSKLKKGQDANHIILFCHYPFFNQTIDEPERNSNLGPDSRQKYLPLFDHYAVEAVFSGHYHNNAFAKFGNTQLVTTSAVGKPLGQAPSGMRVVKMYKDRIEHEYFGLDQMPDSITF